MAKAKKVKIKRTYESSYENDDTHDKLTIYAEDRVDGIWVEVSVGTDVASIQLTDRIARQISDELRNIARYIEDEREANRYG